MFTRKEVRGLFRVATVSGVPIFIHWSVVAIALFMLTGALKKPVMTVVAMASYLSILLVHESGHALVAKTKHCEVYSVELYPIHGLCCFAQPFNKRDHCVIAWGGVIAQVIVAIPLVTYIAFLGYPSLEAIDPVFALLGFFSLFIAAINLLPMGRLDGVLVWQLFPLIVKDWKKPKRPPKNPHGFRTY